MSQRILSVTTELYKNAGGIQRFNQYMLLAVIEQFGYPWINHVISLNDDSGKNTTDFSSQSIYKACHGSKPIFIFEFIKSVIQSPQVVFLNHLHLLPLGYLARLLSPKSKLVGILFGIEAWERVSPSQLKGLQQLDLIISISRYTKMQFCQNNPIDPEKIVVLPLCLDPDWSLCENETPLPGTSGLFIPKPYILSVSRLEALHGDYKGIDCTIQALGQLNAHKLLGYYHYVIVGEGDDLPRLTKLVEENGITDRIIFTGRISEELLKALYANAEIYVLPSKGEGFGLVYLEAMAFGKPVIAGDFGAAGEVVLNGETGFLVPHGDTRKIADALYRLMSSPELRLEMGSKGKLRLLENYTFPIFVNNLRMILSELIQPQ